MATIVCLLGLKWCQKNPITGKLMPEEEVTVRVRVRVWVRVGVRVRVRVSVRVRVGVRIRVGCMPEVEAFIPKHTQIIP